MKAMLSDCLVVLFLRSSRQILLPQYLMNGLNNFDKTDREYSLAPTDDLIRFWGQRSRSHHGSSACVVAIESIIHVDAGTSNSIF